MFEFSNLLRVSLKLKRIFFITPMLIICSSFGKMEVNSIRIILSGIWVQEDYIKSIVKTKSPSRSFHLLNDEACMGIEAIDNDSINICFSFNNHIGGDYQVLLSSFENNKVRLFDKLGSIENYKIEYSLLSNDTTLYVEKFSKTNELLSKIKYLRVLNNPTNNRSNLGIDYIASKILFEGVYTLCDSKDNILSSNVTFDAFGNIEGWSGFRKYELATDFSESNDEYFSDFIFLKGEIGAGNQVFTYRIKKNEILVYKLSNVPNELVYRLRKKIK